MRPEFGAGEQPGGDKPIGELIRDLYQDFSILVDRQVALVKEEAKSTARTAGRAGAVLAAGGLIGLVGFIYLMLACVYALALVMPAWGGALIVGGVLAVAGAIAIMVGVRRLQAITEPLPESRETLREDRAWAREELRELRREVRG